MLLVGDIMHHHHLAADRREESVVDVESVGGQDQGPETLSTINYFAPGMKMI